MDRKTVAVILLLGGACSAVPLAAQAIETVTLQQAVDAALANGFDVRQGELSQEISRLQYAEAEARNKLTVSGSASASRSDSLFETRLDTHDQPLDPNASDTVQAGVDFSIPLVRASLSVNHKITEDDPLAQSTSLSLSTSLTIWDGYAGGKSKASLRQSEISLQGKVLSAESNRKDIAFKAKQAYYTTLSAQRTVGLRQDALSQRQEELKRTQVLFDSGKSSGLDVKQAQINLDAARLDLLSAQDDLAVARAKLSQLAGWPTDKVYAVAEVADPPVPSVDVAELVKMALGQSVSLKQIQLNKEAGAINLDLKRAQLSPTLSASAGASMSLGWEANSDFGQWNVGIQGSIPVFDSGLASAQVSEASKQNEIYRVQEEQAIASIAVSVMEAVSNVRDLLGRVKLAEATLDLTQSQNELANLQFQQGTGTQLDVLAASVKLSSARASLARARSDAQIGVLQLQNAIGQ